MPNIKSAIKRVKVNQKKNLRNRMVKSSVKTAIRKFNNTLSTDTAKAQHNLGSVASVIDKAAAKGVIHRNTANRKKSRLAKALNKATTSA